MMMMTFGDDIIDHNGQTKKYKSNDTCSYFVMYSVSHFSSSMVVQTSSFLNEDQGMIIDGEDWWSL